MAVFLRGPRIGASVLAKKGPNQLRTIGLEYGQKSATAVRFHSNIYNIYIYIFSSPGSTVDTPAHVCTIFAQNKRISDLRVHYTSPKIDPKVNLLLSDYETMPYFCNFSALKSKCPSRF